MQMKTHLWLAIALVASACSVNDQNKDVTDPYAGGGPSTKSGAELITVPIIVEENTKGFSLASATAYTIELVSCESGYESTATNTSTNLQVYRYDVGCLAKLTTFDLNGKTYTPKAGSDFTTWLANDTATFEVASDPTDTLTVKVVSTISNTSVVGNETVSYQFTSIVKGSTSTILSTTVGDAHTMAVGGQAAPNFTIKSISYTGMTAGGAGQFVFKMECGVDITGAAATTACADNLYTDLKYKLVEDTYGSTMTYAQAQTAMGAGTSTITIATDTIAVGASGTVHGGFNTSTLDGPAVMHDHPNMILILEVAQLSYKYFNVDVQVLTQN